MSTKTQKNKRPPKSLKNKIFIFGLHSTSDDWLCHLSNAPKCLKMTWNSQFCLICNFSNLFPPKCLRMTRNGQFCLICNFSNLFLLKWFRMTRNGQFHPIHNFSNHFPLKWLRMTGNGQFYLIHTFSIFSHQSGSQ